MENNLFKDIKIDYNQIIRIVVSDETKSVGKPITVKENKAIQFSTIINNQAHHENISYKNLLEYLDNRLKNSGGGNLVFITAGTNFEYKITKKGKLLSRKSPNNEKTEEHLKEKRILPLDIPAFFDLGICTADGKIISGKRDKFIQIENFTECVLHAVKDKKKVRIIDSGCGKAYLSFIVYHYLKYVKNIDVSITGIDLKKDVVENLQSTAKKYGYDHMEFIVADLKQSDFSGYDMMISLHACDKATDYAIFNAVKSGIESIICVPCCQHEFNSQFKPKSLHILSRYGLIQERTAALMTDAVRASLLTYCGYRVKFNEFVDFGHSPKNIMLRAVKAEVSEEVRKKALQECDELLNEFSINMELRQLIENISG